MSRYFVVGSVFGGLGFFLMGVWEGSRVGLGGVLGPLGASGRHLGARLKLVARSAGCWRDSWGVLEASLGRLGGVLGGLRGSWKPLGVILGTSWGL